MMVKLVGMEEVEVMEEVMAEIAGGAGDREFLGRRGDSGESGRWRWVVVE